MAVCELCGRDVQRLTRHHLIPRTRHSNRGNKRRFDRQDVKERTAMLCPSCHDNVHALHDEKKLERDLNTLEALAADEAVGRYLAWIRKKPNDFETTTRRAK